MQVDIYVREQNGKREMRIPWPPEKIDVESGGTVYASYDIMNRGPVEVPTGVGLSGYKWSSAFPGERRSNAGIWRGTFQPPENYHKLLEDWRAKGTPLVLLVTGYPINVDVTLADYTFDTESGFGDINYTVTFHEHREIAVSAKKVSSATSKRTTQDVTTYTVKSGDTLWGIAEKLLGGGAKWKTIYNANKSIIKSTAIKRWKAAGINRDDQNGHWIFPGTVLSIPKAG